MTEKTEVRKNRRTLILTLLWIGLMILAFGAAWLVYDQITASRLHIVNNTPHSIQITLSGRGFQQAVSVSPSSEQTVRLDVTADTSLRISATNSGGATYYSAAGYFTPGDGQTAQVIFEGTSVRTIAGE